MLATVSAGLTRAADRTMAKDKNKTSTPRLRWHTPTITPDPTTLYASAQLTGEGDVDAKADLTLHADH